MLILLCVLWFPYLSAGTIQVVRLSSYLIVRALIFLIAGLEFFKFDIQGSL